jgi:hypothetical protein
VGTISAFALGPRETKKNLCRDGRSQDLLSRLPKRREIVNPLSVFFPESRSDDVPPAANAYNLVLDKTAFKNTKNC